MAYSFNIQRTRRFTAPDGHQWTVTIARGDRFTGWRWLDWWRSKRKRITDHADGPDVVPDTHGGGGFDLDLGDGLALILIAFLVAVLVILFGPELLVLLAVIARRLAYVLRRRKDWQVAVYAFDQEDHRPLRAVVHERTEDKAAAVLRAEELYASVMAGASADSLKREQRPPTREGL